MKKIHRTLELKEIGDAGTFTGIASVYGNVDLGGDRMMPGAFSKTIAQRKGKFPLFYAHRMNVGTVEVADTPEGLKADGTFNMKKQAAVDVHSDLVHYQKQGVPFGMSIGYTIPPGGAKLKDSVLELSEVDLFEVTLTEVPMNTAAQVIDVKQDFATELDAANTWAQNYRMISALDTALYSILFNGENEDRIGAAAESIDQFRDAYLAWMPSMMALMGEKRLVDFAKKEGLILTSAYKQQVVRLQSALDGLLAGKSGEIEKDEVSRLASLADKLKGAFTWTNAQT